MKDDTLLLSLKEGEKPAKYVRVVEVEEGKAGTRKARTYTLKSQNVDHIALYERTR